MHLRWSILLTLLNVESESIQVGQTISLSNSFLLHYKELYVIGSWTLGWHFQLFTCFILIMTILFIRIFFMYLCWSNISELSVGMTTEGIEVRSVGNTKVKSCLDSTSNLYTMIKLFCVFLIVMDGDRRIIFCQGRSGWLYLFLGETGVDGKIDALVWRA